MGHGKRGCHPVPQGKAWQRQRGEARDEPFLERHATWQHRWKDVAKRTEVIMATQQLGLTFGVERLSCNPALTPLTDLATASTNKS